MNSFISGLFVVLFVIASAEAACDRVDVPVSTGSEFQAALDKAHPGWNIILKKGIYQSDGFRVVAFGVQDCPIIITSKVPSNAVVMSQLSLTSSYLIVSNLTIVHSGTDNNCMYVEGSDIVIDSVNVSGSGGQEDGLMLYGAKNVTVTNCLFENVGNHPVRVKESNNCTITNCTFGDGNCQYHSSSMIWLTSRSNSNVIKNNVFRGSTNRAEEWIEISYFCSNTCSDNEISQNLFVNTDDHVMDQGIWCRSGSNTLIKENNMTVKVNNYAFRVDDTQQRICASNIVAGTDKITDGEIDTSC